VADNTIWIEGGTRSGKTGVLVERFCQWVDERSAAQDGSARSVPDAKILILAGNDDSKRALGDLLAQQLVGRANFPIVPKTTIGFIQDEVLLFYPLLIQSLNLTADFPLRLRPETEQELATKLWQPAIDRANWREVAPSEYRFVRRILDLIQLAAYAGTPLESVPRLLASGFGMEIDTTPIYSCMESLAAEWRDWCLERGLLTYGIMTELYWRHLLPHPTYRQHLGDRYQAILGDDLDDYPAIARNICELLLDAGVWGAFTYNPDGMVRLGLSADPDYVSGLQTRCTSKIYLESRSTPLFGDRATNSPTVDLIVRAVLDPGNFLRLPSRVSAIETRTRGEMLKSAAETAIEQIQRGKVRPGEVAIVAPGLDAISRYTIVDTFEREGIPIESLNAQRPLVSNPSVRAILTLLALTYPNLGQLVSRDEIADLLVTLGATETFPMAGDGGFAPTIDPVRAGLLADYCYAPAQSQPRLLPYTHFPRWDRLNASVATAYDRIVTWVERAQQQQPLPVVLIANAIEYFFDRGSQLPFDRLSALRELMETAQHYWQVAERTYSETEYLESAHQITAQFILLLRQGTVSANPYPITQLKPQNQAVTLSNIFQYRASKRSHPWHFWLDVGSPLWAEGGAATLYGAHLLLKERSRLDRPWTEADTTASNERRLERILRDLCYRVTDRLYLCNSDLAIDGREQMGQLLTLVHSVERMVIS
jgi:hypothetical protein